jgi:phenylacetate-CoA ligase
VCSCAAAAHSPFYRRWLAETGPLGDGPVELQRLPVLDKSLLMEHFDELVCDRRLRRDQLLDRAGQLSRDRLYLDRYRVLLTSGSSGRPGLFVDDATGWRSIITQMLRSSSWAGLAPSLPHQRAAWIGGAGPSHVTRQAGATLSIGVHRVLALPVTLPLPQLVEALNRFQPTYLNVYPSVAMWLADEQQAGRLQLSPQMLVTVGELRTPAMTQRLLDAFGVHPFDVYGSTEGLFGSECQHHQGIHLFEDTTVVESLDPDPCPCGRTLIRVAAIHGRSDDVLSLPTRDGGWVAVHPLHFALLTRDPQVREFQVVQDGPTLRLRIVPNPAVTDGNDPLEARLGQAVTQQLLGLGVDDPQVTVERRQQLSRSADGS